MAVFTSTSSFSGSSPSDRPTHVYRIRIFRGFFDTSCRSVVFGRSFCNVSSALCGRKGCCIYSVIKFCCFFLCTAFHLGWCCSGTGFFSSFASVVLVRICPDLVQGSILVYGSFCRCFFNQEDQYIYHIDFYSNHTVSSFYIFSGDDIPLSVSTLSQISCLSGSRCLYNFSLTANFTFHISSGFTFV